MNDATPLAAPVCRPAPFEILVVEDHPMMIRSIRAGLAALHADPRASDCIATVMVLLFNQIAALPDPSESHALTVFVPAEQTPPIDDWVAATTAASLSSFVAMAT